MTVENTWFHALTKSSWFHLKSLDLRIQGFEARQKVSENSKNRESKKKLGFSEFSVIQLRPECV